LSKPLEAFGANVVGVLDSFGRSWPINRLSQSLFGLTDDAP
jgi:hypothetical protein